MNSIMLRSVNYFVVLVLAAFSAQAQTHSKDYKESFDVNSDVVIEINTSHTDIEFETTNKNRVEVEATIEVEGVSEEDAQKYFERWDFEAKGNSMGVEISASGGNSWVVGRGANFVISGDTGDIDFVMPDLDFDFEPLVLEIPDVNVDIEPLIALPPMPPMPPMHFNFDYDEYKKDGDAYLKKWKKEFKENFDEEWEEEMKAWKEEMEVRKDEIAKWKQEHAKERKERIAELRKLRDEQRQEARKAREEARKVRDEARKEMEKVRAEVRKNARNYNNFIFHSSEDSDVKIKRTIKIKMPKGAKLKMNVRHGEVKLAANIKNINATLSHTRLLADVIDGKQTVIDASYSPVEVANWNYGQLKVNYVKEVDLLNVGSLKLSSNSSDVFIGNILNNGLINGSFGELKIAKVSDGFKSVDIVLENTDAVVTLPKTSFLLYYNGSNSNIAYPDDLKVGRDKNYNTVIVKGYRGTKSTDKSVNVTAKYSDVVMQ